MSLLKNVLASLALVALIGSVATLAGCGDDEADPLSDLGDGDGDGD